MSAADNGCAYTVTVLSGSMQHWDRIQEVAEDLSMKGEIVLVPWKDPRENIPYEDRVRYKNIHHDRIKLADRMVVVNPGGYIGKSTQEEIEYAESLGKPISYVAAPLAGKIITLIGSHKFIDEFNAKEMLFSLQGALVFTPAIFKHPNPGLLSKVQHEILDDVHRAKMEKSSWVYVVNPGGYIGEDTQEEIDWAMERGCIVKYMVEPERSE